MSTFDSNTPPGQGGAGDDDYGLRVEPETPLPEPSVELEKILSDSSDSPSEPIEGEDDAEESSAPPPEADFKQLHTGVFLYPFGLDVLGQTIALMFAAAVLTAMFKTALSFGGTSIGGFGGAGVGAGSMFMSALGGVWLLISIVPASAWGLNVLHTTSYGGETVESWPNLIAFEGVIDAVYVVAGMLMAAVPAVIVLSCSAQISGGWFLFSIFGHTISGVWIISLIELVFFPIVLLAILENNHPLNPFSKAIWKSVFSEFHAWGVFYAMTLLLAGLVIGVFVGSLWIGSWVNAIAVGCMVGAGWIFYFRLLGRLARYCSLKEREESDEDLEAEDDV